MSQQIKVTLIACALILYCFAFQGSRGLYDPDEGRYSAVALQMLKSGDWLVPRTHPEQEHWAKPPLTYWAIAGSLILFGHNEFAVRFPNTLSFLLCIIISFYLGKIFLPKRPWVVALIFATFLFPATASNGATTDFLMTFWQVLAICFFTHAYWGVRDKECLSAIWLMWVAFGLAFLTKGPPALLPLASIIIFLRLEGAAKKSFKMQWPRGVLLMSLIGGGWLIVVAAQKPGLMHYFVWDEFILRFFTGHHERHDEWYSFLYIYFPVLILGSLPWSYFAGQGLARAFREARRGGKKRRNDEERKNLFLALWFSVPLIVFIFSKSNLPLYVLPLFVPLAVMAARAAEEKHFPFQGFRTKIVAWCVLIVLIRMAWAALDYRRDASKFAAHLRKQFPQTVGECVFVNVRPALGLQFYTGADVKHVPLERAALRGKYQGEGARLWFVPPEDTPLFYGVAGQMNIPMQNLGPIRERDNYILFREL